MMVRRTAAQMAGFRGMALVVGAIALAGCTPLADVSETSAVTLRATSKTPLRFEQVALRAIFYSQGARTELPGATCTVSGKGVVTLRSVKAPVAINLPVFDGLPQTFNVVCSAVLGASKITQKGVIRPQEPEVPATADNGPTYNRMGGALFTVKS